MRTATTVAAFFLFAVTAATQGGLESVLHDYSVRPNVTYITAGGFDLKLDVFAPKAETAQTPVALFFHGGGWRGVDSGQAATKERDVLNVLPYLSLGMTVLNVEYRTSKIALAPAAVEDARCAMRWAVRQAKQLNIDPARLILIGESTGGHLALMAGLLEPASAFDARCPGSESIAPAAIVSWAGISDLPDVMTGAHAKTFAGAGQSARTWVGSGASGDARARELSPISYVRPGAPPIITLHGDHDQSVPLDQAVQLHAALDRAQVPNRLVVLTGGGHGIQAAPPEELSRALSVLRAFLVDRGILK